MTRAPQWRDKMPHAGSMNLLDSIDEFDVTSLRASAEILPTNPLANAGTLPATALAEYGAQAMAAHGILLAQEGVEKAVKPGYLVALRDLKLDRASVPLHGRLAVRCQRLAASAQVLSYAFAVAWNDEPMATGRATVAVKP